MPRRELTALLPAVAQLFTFSSPLAVRHGLAVMCRVPSARVKPLLARLSAPLRAAFEMYAPMGLMHEDGQDDPTSAQRGAAGVMALGDWLARVYLARLLCKLIFASVVSGPQKQFMWRVLVRLAFSPREKPHVRAPQFIRNVDLTPYTATSYVHDYSAAPILGAGGDPVMLLQIQARSYGLLYTHA